MGDAFSLEQRLQLGEGAALQEKLEITLLNLVLPLLLLVGSGRKVTRVLRALMSCVYFLSGRSEAAKDRCQVHPPSPTQSC